MSVFFQFKKSSIYELTGVRGKNLENYVGAHTCGKWLWINEHCRSWRCSQQIWQGDCGHRVRTYTYIIAGAVLERKVNLHYIDSILENDFLAILCQANIN
jgi:hypothetical protein